MVSYSLSAIGCPQETKQLAKQFQGRIRFNMGGYANLANLWLMDDVIAWGYGHLKFTDIRTAEVFKP